MRALLAATLAAALALLVGCRAPRRAPDAAVRPPAPARTDARLVVDRALMPAPDLPPSSDDFYRALRLRGGHGGSVGKGRIGLPRDE